MEDLSRKEVWARKSLVKEKQKFIGGKLEFRVATTPTHWLSCDVFHWLCLLLGKKKIFLSSAGEIK